MIIPEFSDNGFIVEDRGEVLAPNFPGKRDYIAHRYRITKEVGKERLMANVDIDIELFNAIPKDRKESFIKEELSMYIEALKIYAKETRGIII